MKLQTLLLAVIVGSMLVLGCISSETTTNPDVRPGGTDVRPTIKAPTTTLKVFSDVEIKAMIDSAVVSANPSICDDLSVSYKTKYSECVTAVAVSRADVSMCERLKGSAGYDGCVSQLAVSRADVSMCERLQGSAGYGGCVTELAVSRADVSMCERLKGSPSYSTCLDEATP